MVYKYPHHIMLYVQYFVLLLLCTSCLVNCKTSCHFHAAKLIPVRERTAKDSISSSYPLSLEKHLGQSWSGPGAPHCDYLSFIFWQFLDMVRQMWKYAPWVFTVCVFFVSSSRYTPHNCWSEEGKRIRVWDRWLACGRHTGKTTSFLLQMEAHEWRAVTQNMCKGCCCFTHQN